MSKVERYRQELKRIVEWEPFLLAESGLPGRRANIELAQAVAAEGDVQLFEHLATFDAELAPTNSPEEFLAFCGVLGLGKLLVEVDREVLDRLRQHAADPRWRIREAVAMALQDFGRTNMAALLEEMEAWSTEGPLVQRAAAAALCEPSLLQQSGQARQVLKILDHITASILAARERHSESFAALRKGMGYCWSVALVALPQEGKPLMEKWFGCKDRDVQWIMKENLKKNRLARMDAEWVRRWREKLA